MITYTTFQALRIANIEISNFNAVATIFDLCNQLLEYHGSMEHSRNLVVVHLFPVLLLFVVVPSFFYDVSDHVADLLVLDHHVVIDGHLRHELKNLRNWILGIHGVVLGLGVRRLSVAGGF